MSEENDNQKVETECDTVQVGDVVNEICKVIDASIKMGFSSFEILGAIEVAKNVTMTYFMEEEKTNES